MEQNFHISDRSTKRRLASEAGCLQDLNDHLKIMFTAFYEAVDNFNKEIIFTPPEARARGHEASLLNSKMIQSIQKNFPKNWKFGRYKRFILALERYVVLFKKLNNKNLPMNITTKSVVAINNQQQLSLFEGTDFAGDPILYFGYNKNRFGHIINPKLIYVDENKLQWTIDENAVNTTKVINLEIAEGNIELPMPKIRLEKVVKKIQIDKS